MDNTTPIILEFTTTERLEEIQNGFSVLVKTIERKHLIDLGNIRFQTFGYNARLDSLPDELPESVKQEIYQKFQAL